MKHSSDGLSAEQASEAEKIILERMQAGPFTYASLYRHADSRMGFGNDLTTYRLADRMIQRERKVGNIKQGGRRGDWLPAKDAR